MIYLYPSRGDESNYNSFVLPAVDGWMEGAWRSIEPWLENS